MCIEPKEGVKMKNSRNENWQGSKWIRPDKRLAIYLRDHFICAYCLVDLHGADPRDITLDHIKSVEDGGNNSEQNLVTACRHCNSSKQDKNLSQFAGPETIKYIRRNARRSLKKYRKLAKALISGEVGFEEIL